MGRVLPAQRPAEPVFRHAPAVVLFQSQETHHPNWLLFSPLHARGTFLEQTDPAARIRE